jgi:hypothetical protein
MPARAPIPEDLAVFDAEYTEWLAEMAEAEPFEDPSEEDALTARREWLCEEYEAERQEQAARRAELYSF